MTAIRGFRGENRWLSNFWSSDTLIEMDGELHTSPSAVATDLRAIVRWLEQLALEEKKPWTIR